MKKIIIVIFLSVATINYSFSQVELLSIEIAGNIGRTNLTFFDDYAAAYNKLLKPSLKSGLGNMRWSYGQSI